jgi:hypothetical protein
MLFEQMFERLKMAHNYGSQPVTDVAVDDKGMPMKFSWRNRKYVVLTVLLTWLESAAWWKADSRDYCVWRVEASLEQPGNLGKLVSTSDSSRVNQKTRASSSNVSSGPASGVYDIAQSNTNWFIRRVID